MSGIEIKNLTKDFGGSIAVNDVSFRVPEKSFTVLLGPSGCGKSTLLRMICGLEASTSGKIFINSKDVTSLEAAKRGVSMVFQSYALFPHLSVKENIQFGLKVRKVPKAERVLRTKEAADVVGLSGLLDRKPANLSGGQRQRVALARTIVSEQSVCLMDEPLSNLDAKLRAEMRDEIRNLQQRLGLTVVYVTHDQVEAMSMADQIVLLDQGAIVQIGSPAEIYTKPKSVFSARFVGVPPMNILDMNKVSGVDFSIKSLEKPNVKSEVQYIGVRPEHISISKRGLPVTVFGMDYFGGETVVRVHYHDNIIYMRCANQPDIKTGDELKVAWPDTQVHIFDKNKVRIPSG
ncbi:ABC transporter ATP-binding protein [Alphaproteobacteria bacterium]|nr:ABC transporter ATP-binding protein [Alphaproteobacteria bacterium]MDC0564483.1 ABC transporter ATP-binding protein [Alphaproteobacteria bacterium]